MTGYRHSNEADPRQPTSPPKEPAAKQALLRAYNREAKALNTAPPIEFTIGRIEAMCLISAVQLACRHPRYTGPSRKLAEDVVRQIASAAFNGFPATKAVVERGWDPSYDDPVE